MKKLATTLAFVSAFCLLSTGCDGSTVYGECVGMQDVDEAKAKHPDLQYKLSTRNTVLSIIFVETLFAPAIWLFADFECPVGKK